MIENIEKEILFNDHFQNHKRYNIPKCQLLLADIPYNVGINAYGSNPSWYIDGNNENGVSDLAGKCFFDTDLDFRIPEFLHFCNKLIKPEPKNRNDAGCMIVFCAFDQQFELIQEAKKYGLNNFINLIFRKNFSAQVLKANMRIVGNCEYAILLYRDKLPKFRNNGKMIFNCIDWEKDKSDREKLHPNQKPIPVLKKLIEIFTDEGDVIIDPVAGSGSSLIAAIQMNRKAFGFEIKKDYYKKANELIKIEQEIKHKGYSFEKKNLFN